MKSLHFLSVMNNCLESLPHSLGYLESLRLLKTAGNPLNEKLNSIVAENDAAPSPMVTTINENVKDAITTVKLKAHLKSEAIALESGGESRFVKLLKSTTQPNFATVRALSIHHDQ